MRVLRQYKFPALALLLIAFMGFFSIAGCGCLTNRMWNSVRLKPRHIKSATIENNTLTLIVQYEGGRQYTADVPLDSSIGDYRDLKVKFKRLKPDIPLASSETYAWTYSIPGANTELMLHTGVTNLRLESYAFIMLTYQDRKGSLDCPMPIDWSRAGAWLAIPATPFTLLIDIVTLPVEIVWIIWTAGGHGDHWLPWCNID